jgi:chromosome segregation ATPase
MCEYSVAQLAQVKAHDLLTELEQCKAECQQYQLQLEQCRTELEAAKKEAARRTEELARYTSELEAANKAASEAEAANKPASHTQSCNLGAPATVEQLAAKNTISLHLTELEQCKAECKQYQIQLEQCRTESAQFTSSLAQCTTKCKQYEAELEKARTDLQHYDSDLTRRLDSAMKELEHVQEQLRLCQQARDQSHRALQLAEEQAEEQVGEYKHSAEVAREELRVAVHRLEDAVAAKECLQLQLDSEPDLVHSELENTNVLIEQTQEALRKKNLELHDLKNMNRKLESEMQLLCKDRAIITTQQVADRRALQNKYKVCEDNRRMLELQNIDLQALNSQYADRIKELTKQLLSNKWGKHADEMEQRRMHALHVELQAQTEAREDAERKAEEAERKVEQLKSFGCLDTNAKRPRHVLKEPLYRAQLLQKVVEKNLK